MTLRAAPLASARHRAILLSSGGMPDVAAPRFTYAGALHHVTLRCNNREFLFTPHAFERFLLVLQRARRKFPIALYHYCLMTNHVRPLFEVRRDDTLAAPPLPVPQMRRERLIVQCV